MVWWCAVGRAGCGLIAVEVRAVEIEVRAVAAPRQALPVVAVAKVAAQQGRPPNLGPRPLCRVRAAGYGASAECEEGPARGRQVD